MNISPHNPEIGAAISASESVNVILVPQRANDSTRVSLKLLAQIRNEGPSSAMAIIDAVGAPKKQAL